MAEHLLDRILRAHAGRGLDGQIQDVRALLAVVGGFAAQATGFHSAIARTQSRAWALSVSRG